MVKLRPLEICPHNTIIVNDVKYLVVQLKGPAAAINIVRNEENIPSRGRDFTTHNPG